MSCPEGPKHRRVSKTSKGNPSSYRSSIRGHKWKGHGVDRVCENCGKKPERLFISRFYEVKK